MTIQVGPVRRTFSAGEAIVNSCSEMSCRDLICRAAVVVMLLSGPWAVGAEYAVRVEPSVPATMRDGVKLKADIYRPEGAGEFPVLLGRTPYGKQIAKEIAQKLAKRGYIVAMQDVRGRGESEGKFQPFFDDERDGYDSVEWAAGLPQSTGKVGMVLSSYGSSAQIFAALAAPPHLVTFVAIQPAIGFGAHQIFFDGGAFRQLWAESWTITLASDSYSRMMHKLGTDASSLEAVMRRLPLGSFMDQLSQTTLETEGGSYFQRWLSNPPWSRYWDPINLSKRVADIKLPALYFGGWYDVFGPATSQWFEAVQRNAGSAAARTKSQFIMGPWTHGGTSDIDFGPDATLDIVDLQNQWLDYWLKDEPNGVMSHPAVRVFLTGENRWIPSPSWPLTGTGPYPLFLSSKTSAQSSSGDGLLTSTNVPAGPSNSGQDILNADPSNPVPTKGGELCCHGAYPAGAHYQTEIEKRRDVLTYTTPPLSTPLVVVGEPVLTLHIASDAPDADLIAKLIDVSPDQKAWNVADGTLRLRYRSGTERTEWLEKDKIYSVSIRLSALAHSFLAGHSVRLQIAGSDFPNYSVNLNSRADILDGTVGHAARTSIEHSPRFPSFLELPRLAQEAMDPKKKVDKDESLR